MRFRSDLKIRVEEGGFGKIFYKISVIVYYGIVIIFPIFTSL